MSHDSAFYPPVDSEQESEWSQSVMEYARSLVVLLEKATPALKSFSIDSMTTLTPDGTGPRIAERISATVIVTDIPTEDLSSLRPVLRTWLLKKLQETGLFKEIKLGAAVVIFDFETRGQSKGPVNRAS